MARKKLVLRLATLSLAMLLGACSAVTTKLTGAKREAPPRTDADESIQVGDRTRLYDLYVPSTPKNDPLPLVIALHGSGGTGKTMERTTGLSQLAEQEKFIVVYPDAINKHWDARRRSTPETTNDVGFISALIEKLEQQYPIDRDRIYVTGFSNGGTFTHRLACELSDKIAAAAVVAATIPANLANTCQPNQPVAMLMMHGTQDEAIPYDNPGKGLLTLTETVSYWSKHDRCESSVVKETLPDNPKVRVETYPQCNNNTRVKLYLIEDGKHRWGDKTVDATALIWDFFSQHKKP